MRLVPCDTGNKVSTQWPNANRCEKVNVFISMIYIDDNYADDKNEDDNNAMIIMEYSMIV